MIHKIGYELLRWAGVGVFALAVVFPAGMILWRCASDGAAPVDGWGFSSRQIGLLARTFCLALPAALLALALALPVAATLGADARTRSRTLLWGLTLCPLMFSPTVLTFGWARVWARWDRLAIGEPLCVWTWATWLWPIPALILGAGWARVGRSAYEAALLDVGRLRALRIGALPVLRGHVLSALLIMLVLFCADYNVPHASSIQVYATELLAWAANYPAPIHVLWYSVPLVTVLALLALAGWAYWARWRRGMSATEPAPQGREARSWPAWCVILTVVVAPQIGLLAGLDSTGSFAELGRTYGWEITTNLGFALLGGFVGVALGLACSTWGRTGRACAFVILLVGFLPGAVVGKALGLAYVRVPLVYDHWPIMVLAYAGRFAWIGVLASWGTRHLAGDDLEQAARLDGAAAADVFWRVRVALARPALLGAGLAASGMCLADIATASQVALPQYGLLSMILMEKFHRFEDRMLVTLSLTLEVLPILAVLLMTGIVSRGFRGKSSAGQSRRACSTV